MGSKRADADGAPRTCQCQNCRDAIRAPSAIAASFAGFERKPRSILGPGTEAPAGQPANPGGTAPGAPGGLLDRLQKGPPAEPQVPR